MGPISAPSGLLRLSGVFTFVTAVTAILTAPSIEAQRPQMRRPRDGDRIAGRMAAAGEVLVRLRPSPAAQTLVDALDSDVNERLGGGLRRLRSRSLSTAELLARLRGHGDVIIAEPNYKVSVAMVPDDPL